MNAPSARMPNPATRPARVRTSQAFCFPSHSSFVTRLIGRRRLGQPLERFEQFFCRREIGGVSRCDVLNTSLDLPPFEICCRSKLHDERASMVEVSHWTPSRTKSSQATAGGHHAVVMLRWCFSGGAASKRRSSGAGPDVSQVLPGRGGPLIKRARSLRPADAGRWRHVQNRLRVPIDRLQELNQETP